ncbi:MAG TPA: TraM recognition domain-containing protein, partial [Patescibacteria group bacterium]|nr:TraM recognition domain-containing protein [Patescibacteria group bacterium]
VIYFDPADVERPIGLNMLEAATPEEMDFVSQEMVSMFYQLVTDPSMIGPMFEHSMRNAMFTLMANKENPGTIADIPRIFTDDDFVKYNLQFVTDPMVRAYWEKEMAKQSEQQKGEMLGYLISKVGRFVENGLMRNIIGQQKSGFDFADVMNNQKILLVNLSKGKIGDINSQLLGLIIVSKLTMAALRRAGMAEEERRDFYLYIDEFQNYITDSISTILSEARKYRLSLIIAHQYIGQLVKNGDPKIKEAVLGNAGTICSFKIGIEDAEIIAKEFAPTVNAYDLINTENFHMYMKLLVDNRSTRAFTVKTIYEPAGDPMLAEKLKQLSRLKFGRERKQIEAEVLERTKLGQQ